MVAAAVPGDGAGVKETVGPRRAGFLQDAGESLLARGWVFTTGVLVSILTARALGPEGRGQWALALLIPFFLGLLSDMGLGVSGIALLREFPRRGSEIVTAILLIGSTGSALSIALFWALYPLGLDALFAGVPLQVVAVASAAALPSTVAAHLRSCLIMLGDLRAANVLVAAHSGLMLALLTLVFGFVSADVLSAIMVYGSALVIGVLAGLWRLASFHAVRLRLDLSVLGQLLALGWRAHVATIGLFLCFRADLSLVNYWVGIKGAGYYSVALSLSEALRGVPEAVQASLLSRLSASRGQPALDLTAVAARVSLTVTAALAITAAVIAVWLVPALFGRGFSRAVAPFWLLLPGSLALAVSYVVGSPLMLHGCVSTNAAAAWAAFVTLVVVDAFLIPRYGIEGAALGSSLSYAVMTVWQVSVYCVRFGVPVRQFVVPRSGEWRVLLRG